MAESRLDEAWTGTLPDGNWPPVALEGVVELRVHGVGGTPPADMLDDPAPTQVSGDRIAGVWRGQAPATGPSAVEAYSWGGLTERSLGAALWLVVLPFALVNVAGWMPPRRGSLLHGLYRGVVRLAGLALTAIYVVFAAVVGMDFVTYQCAGKQECIASSWWLIGDGAIAHSAARRVVVGALLPMAVVLGLALLTRVSRRRYEQWRLDPQAHPPTGRGVTSDGPAQAGLTSPQFWTGQGYAAHLAEIHLFLGCGVVALLLSTTAAATTASTFAPTLTPITIGALLLGAACATVTRVRTLLPPRLALGVGLLLVVTAGVTAWTARPLAPLPESPLPGILETFGAVLLVFFGSATAALILGLCGHDRGHRLRRAYTPFALLVLGGLLGSAVLAGAALWVAGAMGHRYGVGSPSAATDKAAILYPQPFEAIARSLILVAILTLAVISVVGIVVARHSRGDVKQKWQWLKVRHERDLIDVGGLCAVHNPAARWERRVRRALRLPALLLAVGEWGIWTLAGLGWLAIAGYGVFWLAHGDGSDAAIHRYNDLQSLPLVPLSWSITALTLLPIGTIWLMRRSLRQSSTRRRVGIAWDVATFWPRAFHPLCPPCYAERAVPETQTRLLRIWAAGGAVDLLGHSQGAIVVTAAVAGLPEDRQPPLRRLTLLTYGNPLMRLYHRHFPSYVNDELVETVSKRLRGDWTNVYRDTDPIGAPIEHDRVRNVRLPDPATDRYLAGDLVPQVRGHAERDYRRQTPFIAEVTTAVALLKPVTAAHKPAGPHTAPDHSTFPRTAWAP